MDRSLPGSSVHGISQARTLGWVAISSSRRSSQPRDQTLISCTGRQILYYWVTYYPQGSKRVRHNLAARTTKISLDDLQIFHFYLSQLCFFARHGLHNLWSTDIFKSAATGFWLLTVPSFSQRTQTIIWRFFFLVCNGGLYHKWMAWNFLKSLPHSLTRSLITIR